MASYSKQYVDQNNFGIEPDFDILEEANNIQNGYYLPLICEGFGFLAVAKDENGEILLAFQEKETDNIIWESYNNIVK